MSAPAPVEANNLTVRYHDRTVIQGVDLTLPPGRITALIGPNGAGKSSLLQACLGLLPHQQGEVRLFGEPISRGRRHVAYIPQRSAVDFDFPIEALQVVYLGLVREVGWFRRIGRSHRARALAAMERVGVDHLAHKQIGELSGGEQQRVFLARAMVQDARLLVMDEALSGVDLATEQLVFGLFREFCQQGRTVWMVHHDLHTVAGACDDAMLFRRQVLAHGCAAEVLQPEVLERCFGAPLVVAADEHDLHCGNPVHSGAPAPRGQRSDS